MGIIRLALCIDLASARYRSAARRGAGAALEALVLFHRIKFVDLFHR